VEEEKKKKKKKTTTTTTRDRRKDGRQYGTGQVRRRGKDRM
jgi:hypothetical protein